MPSAASASWKAARWSGSSSAITPSKSKMSARGPRGMGASYSGAGDAGQPRRGSIESPGSMKTTFRPRLLNGQTGDPALLVSLRWQGRALLVDLGRIDRTPAATLLPIEAVFVSHTHMDHFMGFDQLLRLFLARDATLRLYGPAGLADCVAGKLAGYTWNLTDEYAFTLEVTEIAARQMTSWRFAARQRFAREPLGPPRPFTGVVVTDPVFTVEAAPLDHKIVSMAYAMTERTHLNLRPEALAAAGLEPGPWLNALKQAIRTGAPDDTPIQVTPGDRRPLGALSAELITVTPGQKVAYVVDTLFSPANAAAIVRLAAAGADGAPNVIPVCYALDDEAVYFVADEKPKRRPARELLRFRKLRATPRAALVVDDYDEDWTRLAYVLVRGPARVVEAVAAHAGALRLLRARYPQYGRMALDDPTAHPVVRIQPARIVVWRAAG